MAEETVEPNVNPSSDRTLDRPLDLTQVPLEALAWVAVTAVALGISLIGRTNWPLSEGESAIARDAWALFQGNDLTATADSHPLIVQLTALAFFMFGDTDNVARLVPLLGGIGIIATLYWLRSWFGSLPTLSVAIVWAISPVMSLSLLRLDGGAILVLCSLLTFVLVISMPMDPHRTRAVILGVALAIGLTVHPLGWIVLPLTILVATLLIRDIRLGGEAIATGASFLITMLVITTWFATRLTAPLDFVSQSLSRLVDDHLSGLGSVWQAPFALLLADELLLLALIAAGIAVLVASPRWSQSAHPAVFISCVAWALPVLALGVLLSGKGPALYSVSMFPLVVVAGLGLAMLLDGLANAARGDGRPVLWGAILLALIVAIIRFADSAAQGPDGDTAGWIINLLAVALLILAPLAYLIIRLSAGTNWGYLPVAGMVIVLILGGVGLRTTILLPDTGQDRPGELLQAGNTAPSVGSLQQRLRTYSRDATTYIQDVRDPAGGHGLMIVVHQNLADPVAWYFRDFPNLAIVTDPADIPEDVAPDAAFIPADEREEWSGVLLQHEVREFPLQNVDAEEIPRSTLTGLVLSSLNPLEYRNLVRYSVYRANPGLIDQEPFVLALREDHAAVIWGQ